MSTAKSSTSILPLEIKSLSYRIGEDRLLDKINLTFTAEPLTVILGANGAGKTLLMKICTGLLQPTQGEVCWQHNGKQSTRGQFGYTLVFQKPVLLRRSAISNIIFALHGLPKKERRQRAIAALQWAGAESFSESLATTLSTGQQQLIALAQAWAIDPGVLFLDEPCANLDPEVSTRIEQLILQLHNRGKKIIMTTHNLTQAQRLADEIIFVKSGRISKYADAEQFFDQPKCDSARRYLDAEIFCK